MEKEKIESYAVKVEQLRRNIENTCKVATDFTRLGFTDEDEVCKYDKLLFNNLNYYIEALRAETEKMLGE